MKTVVITGSARGLGFEMAKQFIQNDFNVVICDILEEKLENSRQELSKMAKDDNRVLALKCDVTVESDLQNVLDKAIIKYKNVDIWINNAGVIRKMV